MKRGLFAIAISLLVTLVACEEDPKTPIPAIRLGETEVTLDSDGKAVSIGYAIENPVGEEKIAVEKTADWLRVNTHKVRTIELVATPNETGEVRTAEVTISYPGAESVVVKVTQQFFESPLTINIDKITATEVFFSIETTDPELTWVSMVAYKEGYDEVEGSDDMLFREDMEYFEYIAGINDLTLEEFLEMTVFTGSYNDGYVDDLLPTTEYVLYAYGLTTGGRRTTEIVAVPFTTEAPWEGDITFEFDVREEDHVMYFDITPSHTGVNYYYGVTDEETFNMWREQYGTDDLRTLIQKGDIEHYIQMFKDYDFIDDNSEYFGLYNETGRVTNMNQACRSGRKYIFYAAKWDTDCQIIGEVSTYWHQSAEVAMSDNQISLTLGEVSQSSAEVSATTTNNDPYVILAVKSSEIEGLNDDEIFDYIYSLYDSYLQDFTYSGNHTRTQKRLEPSTKYTFLAFGYKAGTLTTATITKLNFTTASSTAPEDCTFEFEWEGGTDYAWVKVTPSDNGHFYHWMVYPESYTADDAKAYIQMMIDEWYEGDVEAFSSWVLSQGPASEEVSGLYADTAYKVGAIVMDYYSGKFLGDMHFSQTYRTEAQTYADVTISVDFGPYYDIKELVAAGHTEYKSMLEYGDAVMPARAVVTGQAATYYYTVYRRDLTNVEEYPDDIFIKWLPEDGSSYEETNFAVAYNYPLTMVAVALDREGNFSPIYRQTFNCTKDGSSPISDFVGAASSVAAKLSKAFEPSAEELINSIRREQRERPLDVVTSSERAASRAAVESARREGAEARFRTSANADGIVRHIVGR